MKLLYHNKYILCFFKGGTRSINDLFKKGTRIADSLFQNSRGLASSVSRGSKIAGEVLEQVADIGSKILNDPNVRHLANYNNDTRKICDISNKGVNLAHLGSSLGKQVSRFTDEGSYRGSHDENLRDALQRAKPIQKEANLVHYI